MDDVRLYHLDAPGYPPVVELCYFRQHPAFTLEDRAAIERLEVGEIWEMAGHRVKRLC